MAFSCTNNEMGRLYFEAHLRAHHLEACMSVLIQDHFDN